MNKHTVSAPRAFQDMPRAIAYLEQAVNYEKQTDIAYDRRHFNLERMRKLLEELDAPQRFFRSVHIAGTKGKGSSATLIEHCLHRSGLRTGLHTSPHISSICERMLINGSQPSEAQFCALLSDMKPVIDAMRNREPQWRPTYFELTTALSLALFARSDVAWAVVEVGLGGRLDATNVISPEICIITPIGFDHMDKLGNTAAEIAGEKAGILKPEAPLMLSRQNYPEASATILNRADDLGCKVWQVGRDVRISNGRALIPPADEKPGWRFDLQGPGWEYNNLYLPLLGRHQVDNAATAVGAVELLKKEKRLQCPPDCVRAALASCACPARVQLLQENPPLLLDTAHTKESTTALVEALRTHFPYHQKNLVFGCSSDKNHEKMLRILAGISGSITLTQSSSPRAETTGNLARSARKAGFTEIREHDDPVQAVRERLNKASDLTVTCITGSFFLAGDILAAFSPDRP